MAGESEYLLGFGVDPASFAKINADLSEGIKGAVTSEINVVLVGDVAALEKTLGKSLKVEVIPDFNQAALKKLKATIDQVFAGSAQGLGGFGAEVKQFQMGTAALEKAVGSLKSLNLGGFAQDLARQVAALHGALNETRTLGNQTRTLGNPTSTLGNPTTALGSGGAGGGGGGKNPARNTPRDDDTDQARRSMVAMHTLDVNRAKRDAFRQGYLSAQYPGYEFQTERRQLPPQPESLGKGSPYFRQTERFKNYTFGRIPRSVTLQDVESSYSVGMRANTEVEDRYLGGIDQRAKRAKDRNIDAQVRIGRYTSPTTFDKKAKQDVGEILRDLNTIKHDAETALYLAQEVESQDIGGLKSGLAAMEGELKTVNAALKQKQEPGARQGLKIRKGDLDRMVAEHKAVEVQRQEMMLDLQQGLGGVQAQIDHFVREEAGIVAMGEKIAADARTQKAADRRAERDTNRAVSQAAADARAAKRKADAQAERDAAQAKKDAEKAAKEAEYARRSDNWILGQMGGNYLPSGAAGVGSYQHDRGRYVDPVTGKATTYGEIERVDRRRTAYGELPYRTNTFDQTTKERIVQEIMGAPEALDAVNKALRAEQSGQRAADRQQSVAGSVWMSDRSRAGTQARLGQERVHALAAELEALKQAAQHGETVMAKLYQDKDRLITEGAAEEVIALKEADASVARQFAENIEHEITRKEAMVVSLNEEAEKLAVAAQEAAEAQTGRGGRHRGLGDTFRNMWQYALVGGAFYGAQAQVRGAIGNATQADDTSWQFKHATPGAESQGDWGQFFDKQRATSRVFSAYFAKDQKEVQETLAETYRKTEEGADKWKRLNTAALATAKILKFTAITGGDASETLKDMNAAAVALGTQLHSLGGRFDDVLGKIIALSARSPMGEQGSRQGIKTEGAANAVLQIISRTGGTGRALGFSDDFQLAMATALTEFAPGGGKELGSSLEKLLANFPKAGQHLRRNKVMPRFNTPYAESDFLAMLPQIAADEMGASSGFQLPNNTQQLIQIARNPAFAKRVNALQTVSAGAGKEAFDAAFEQRMETTQKKIERMRYEWEALTASLAEKLLPVIATVADKITDIIAGFQKGHSAANGFLQAVLGLVVVGALFKMVSMAVNGLMAAFGKEMLLGSITTAKTALVDFFTVGLVKGAFLVGMMALATGALVTLGRTAREQSDAQEIAAKRKEIGTLAVDFREGQQFTQRYIRKGKWANFGKGMQESFDETLGGGAGISVTEGSAQVEAEGRLHSGGPVGWGNAHAYLLRTGVGALMEEAKRLPANDPRQAQIAALLGKARLILGQMDATGTNGYVGGINKLPEAGRQEALGVIGAMDKLLPGGDWQGTPRNMLTNAGSTAAGAVKGMIDGMLKGTKGALKNQYEDILKDANHAAATMGQEQPEPTEGSNTWEARLEAFRAKVAAFDAALSLLKERQDEYRHHTDMTRMAVEGLAAQEQALNSIYQGRKIPIDELRRELAIHKEKLAAQIELIGAMKEEARQMEFTRFRAGQLQRYVPAVERGPGDPGGPSLGGDVRITEHGALHGNVLTKLPRANVAGLTPAARDRLTQLNAVLAQSGQHAIITSARDGHAGVVSEHNAGRAIDMQLSDRRAMPAYIAQLRRAGFDASYEHKGQVNANGSTATGDHIHINLVRAPLAAGLSSQQLITLSQAKDAHQVAQVLASSLAYAGSLGAGPLGAIKMAYGAVQTVNAAGARGRARIGTPGAAFAGIEGASLGELLTGDSQQNQTVQQTVQLRKRLKDFLLGVDKDAAQMKVSLLNQGAAIEKEMADMAQIEGQILSRPFTDYVENAQEALRKVQVAYKEHSYVLEDANVIASLFGNEQEGIARRLANTSQELTEQSKRLAHWSTEFKQAHGVFETFQALAFPADQAIHMGLQPGQQDQVARLAALYRQQDQGNNRTLLKDSEYTSQATQAVEGQNITADYLKELRNRGINVNSVPEFVSRYKGFFRRQGMGEFVENVSRQGYFSRGDLNALATVRDKAKEHASEIEGLRDAAHQAVSGGVAQSQQLGGEHLLGLHKDALDDTARDMKILNDQMARGRELAQAMGVEFERTPEYLASSAQMMGLMVDKIELLKAKLADISQGLKFSDTFYAALAKTGMKPADLLALNEATGLLGENPFKGVPKTRKELETDQDAANVELAGARSEFNQAAMGRIGRRPYNYDFATNMSMLGFAYSRDQMMAGMSPDRVREMRDARDRYVQGLQGNAASTVEDTAKKIAQARYSEKDATEQLENLRAEIAALPSTSEDQATRDRTKTLNEQQESQAQTLAAAQAEVTKQLLLYNDALGAQVQLQKIAKNNEEVRFYQDTIKNAAMEWATGRGVNARGRRGESVLLDRFKEAFKSIGGASYERNVSRRLDDVLGKFFGRIGLTEEEPPQIKVTNANTDALIASTKAITDLTKAMTPATAPGAAGLAGTLPGAPAPGAPSSTSTTDMAGLTLLGGIGAMAAMGLDAAKLVQNRSGAPTMKIDTKAYRATSRNQTAPRLNKGQGVWGAQDYGAALGDAFGAYQAGANAGGGIGGALMGGFEGAMAGSQFGPIGTAAGAVIGMLGSIFGSGEKHRHVTEKIFNQMPRRQDVLYAASAYLPFSAYAGGRFSRFEFAVNLQGLLVGSAAHAQIVGQAVSDAVAPMVKAQFARGPVSMRGT